MDGKASRRACRIHTWLSNADNSSYMARPRKLTEHELAAFLQQYKRKRRPGFDPNDRRYDHKIQELIRRMSPEELDALMHGDEEDQEQT